MYAVAQEVRRYILTGTESEYMKMLAFVNEHGAKVVKEVRNEPTRGVRGIVIYAERLLRKLRKGRTH